MASGRRDLPTGTVTFLFTDVEGSTKLLHELGAEGYAEALAEHRGVIRDTCASEGGVEVDTQGDAFFFAFPTAPGALAAAEEMTRELGSGPIQVRIGLHTGTPLLTDEGYVGGDVHRAARIAGSGHGGQVLVSASTAALIEPSDKLSLGDLGEHRFKDLSAPERVYQLGQGEFPALKSLYRTNLPVPATPFLGRERELAEVVGLLAETRLLTLTGPGGTGKTRLALQSAGMAADSYPDGIYWVPLAPLREPTLVLEEAARALGSKGGLAEHIVDKRLLLLFDNFERVVDAASDVASLLASCPKLRVVVTSRELLRVPGEHAYAVPPLAAEDGITLFTARARASRADFEPTSAVAALCERLDNLPLALELAAARVRVLTLEQLLERLSDALDLLTAGRGVDARQQTLRATLDWSYELLTEDEQRLFARLAVFAGGCTLEAAEEVAEANLDTLQALVDKSLVRFDDGRYRMLETIREYAAEKLEESGGAGTRWERLAQVLVALAEAEGAPMFFDRQEQAFARLGLEHANTRAVVEWAMRSGRNDLVAGLYAALMEVWVAQGHQREVAGWIEAAEAGCRDVPADIAVNALAGAAEVAEITGDVTRAKVLYEEALALASSSTDVNSFWEPASLVQLSRIALGEGDIARAREIAERSLELRVAGDLPRARALAWLGEIALREGDLDRAERLLEEALQRDEPRHAVNDASYREALGEVLRRRGDAERAETLFRDSMSAALALGNHAVVADCLDDLALLANDRGNTDRAARYWATGRAVRAVVDAAPARPREIRNLPDLARPVRFEDLESAVSFALGETNA